MIVLHLQKKISRVNPVIKTRPSETTWVIRDQTDLVIGFTSDMRFMPEEDFADFLDGEVVHGLGIPLDEIEAMTYVQSLPGRVVEVQSGDWQIPNAKYQLVVSEIEKAGKPWQDVRLITKQLEYLPSILNSVFLNNPGLPDQAA